MSTINGIQELIGSELQALNAHIAESLHSPNELMNSVIASYLKSKGKQIRPILVILSARLFGGEMTPKVMSAAAAVEMLHNATLIHDDVVDQAGHRRGHATINSVWDNHIAVLIGDYFVSTSLQEAIATADLRIVETLASLGRLLSVGEMDQIYNARFHRLTEEGYYRVIARKTASLFEACVRMGAYAVGVAADDPRLEALARYAHALGLCFQIRDDIFDYYSDPAVGKPTGNDLREGKVTLPLIHALTQGAPDSRREQMLALLRKDMLDDDDIARLTAYAIERGGIEYAYATMQRLSSDNGHALDAFPDTRWRRAIESVFTFIISRTY